MLQAKSYWSILLVDNKLVTNNKTKANISNEYFAEQSTLLKNSSVLPINHTFLTQSGLTSLYFNEEEILKPIRALNKHKANGHDDVSIGMIKICDKSLLTLSLVLLQICNNRFIRHNFKTLICCIINVMDM